MLLILVLVFIGVFGAIAVPLIYTSLAPARGTREAMATLESALNNQPLEVRHAVLDVRKDERMSSIPWLNRKMAHLQLVPSLHSLLQQAQIKWSPGRLMAIMLVCFAVPAYAVEARFRILLAAGGAGLVVGLLPLGWVLWKRGKRFSKFEQGLPEALDMMVSALRAGHSLISAMGLVARECAEPVAGEFKACFEEQNYGLEMKAALDNLTGRMPLQDLRMVSTAIMIQKESGGNLAEVLDKTSYLIRERFRLKRQVSVHTAQGRMTGWVLTCVPVALGVAMYMVNPKMMSILWHRPIGIKMIWAAVGMIVLGGFIINRIVDIDV